MSAHPETLRILLVEDHVMVRQGLCKLLNSEPNLTVVAQAGSRAEALALAAQEQPEMILLNLHLGQENSLDFLPDLRALVPQAPVIVFTATHNPEDYKRALAQGAKSVVCKDQDFAVLLQAIERVQTGHTWLEPSVMASVLTRLVADRADHEAARIATLTARERAIIGCLGAGLSNQEIADQLVVSESSVRHHLKSIFKKLDVSDRLKLALYAYRHNLIQPSP
jgi:two-component system, NarL family, nitrate/nitrite response regulator NarL